MNEDEIYKLIIRYEKMFGNSDEWYYKMFPDQGKES